MRSRALRVRDVMNLMGVVNFCKRPWMTSGQLAAIFPISVGAYQPGSTVCAFAKRLFNSKQVGASQPATA